MGIVFSGITVGSSAAMAADPTINDLFPRVSVAGQVAAALGKARTDTVTPAQLASIQSFEMRFGDLASLNELAPLTGLKSIDVRGNNLTNLDGVQNFPTLNSLVVMMNSITDVAGLSGSGLSDLAIGYNPLSTGFSSFATLSNLRTLEARSANVTDQALSQMSAATGVTAFNLSTCRDDEDAHDCGSGEYANRVTSIQPLLALHGLTGISLDGNSGLRSIAGISALPNVTAVSVGEGTQVTDFSELNYNKHTLYASRVNGKETLTYDPSAATVTYTHPYKSPANAGVPDRSPVASNTVSNSAVAKVPYNGVVSWDPSTQIATITWNTADIDGLTSIRYEHRLNAWNSTQLVWGWMDLTLVKQVPTVVEHTVTYDLAGGAGSFPAETVADGATVTAPTAVPTRDGYTFAGWKDTSGSAFDFSAAITADTTVVASWTEDVVPVVEHTVTYDLAGGAGSFPAETVADGATVTAPATVPTRDGYTFAGWKDTSGTAFDFSAAITADTTVVASWTMDVVPVVEHTVTYDLAGGAGSFPAETVADGTTVTAPTAVPTRDGYTFAGWKDTSGSAFDFSAAITADTTVVASWTKEDVPVVKHTVSYDLAGGAGSFPAETVANGLKPTQPKVLPTRSGYTFTGWKDSSGAAFDFSKAITADTTVFAGWEKVAVPPEKPKPTPPVETPNSGPPVTAEPGTNAHLAVTGGTDAPMLWWAAGASLLVGIGLISANRTARRRLTS
ncbi:hypothetical protein G7068_06660 [Leucobacter viscericola]|uniref:Internalin-A n=1 Tax=Leucobacter viscericola TaxID=2714935 RepID=A0A6G7XEM0_9MICO|nr:InlB B-repeat-containing protein [Leucobacter viscericola]QIK62916.1 hypothetical protein G7068_06660 [Leucobacter viscericola]